jgi:protein-tyrosine phosphatase
MGNICRSPTAEAVLRVKARQAGLNIEFDSAGTEIYHVGDARIRARSDMRPPGI